MAETPEKSPRIIAGPIEDLGLKVDRLTKLGLASFKHTNIPDPINISFSIPSSWTLQMETQSGLKEVELDLPRAKSYSFLAMLSDYLFRNKMYLARTEVEIGFKINLVTGDLYLEN